MSDGLSLCVSKKMQPIRDLVAKVAVTNTTVLLRGESGVGKEVVARALHQGSPRAANQFLKVNCAALPGELLESELFGHEKGSFTGAYRQKPGKFEAADGGTLLLDEIGEMPLRLQAKLLHVLQDGEFSRVGGEKIIDTDVRLIAATNRDLESALRTHQFREDLYYRLNVIEVRIPPLRERREEIPVMVDYFLRKFNLQFARTTATGTGTETATRRWPPASAPTGRSASRTSRARPRATPSGWRSRKCSTACTGTAPRPRACFRSATRRCSTRSCSVAS